MDSLPHNCYIYTEEATNVIYDYIDVTLPATVTSNTIPTEPNTAYATTLRQTNAIETMIRATPWDFNKITNQSVNFYKFYICIL